MFVLDFDVEIEIVAGVGDWIMLGIVKLHAVVTVVEVGVELMELFSGSSPNNENIINETTPAVEEFLQISWAVVEEIFFQASHKYVGIAGSYSRSHGCAQELKPKLFVEFEDVTIKNEFFSKSKF